jgi:hypothetical protein
LALSVARLRVVLLVLLWGGQAWVPRLAAVWGWVPARLSAINFKAKKMKITGRMNRSETISKRSNGSNLKSTG